MAMSNIQYLFVFLGLFMIANSAYANNFEQFNDLYVEDLRNHQDSRFAVGGTKYKLDPDLFSG